MAGIVTLLGAGELMAATSRLHRAALDRIGAPPRPVFLDTTAGFESNIQAIVEKAVEYYRHHLQQDLRVAAYRHQAQASAAETAAAVTAIRDANFVFAGPGSPSYAIRQWQGSPVLDALAQQYEDHAHLFFASAASITLGRHALPVYEIYKAGSDPHWIEGLDFLGRLGLNVAVVPHFNDNSGGDNYDTRFCYMGAGRFDALQQVLPDDVTILGLDAYTALTLDHHAGTAVVSGQGGLTVIGEGGQRVYPAGTTLSFGDLQSSHREVVPTATDGRVFTGYDYADDAADADANHDALTAYIESLDVLPRALQVELLTRIEGLKATLANAAAPDDGPLVDLVLELRQALREAKRYDLADQARDRLTALGYVIADGAGGATWTRPDA